MSKTGGPPPLSASSAALPDRCAEIWRRLDSAYPKQLSFLTSRSPYELLIAVILSAQTTDRQVNSVTGTLFGTYPTPEDLAAADLEEVEQIIRTVGFSHVKAANIIAAAQTVVSSFRSAVPASMDELLTIPGIGRKSANVILGAVFGLPAVIVDTHFSRVVRRLGLTAAVHPAAVENEIARIIDPRKSYRFSMTVNYHGRTVCRARRPECAACQLNDLCLFFQAEPQQP